MSDTAETSHTSRHKSPQTSSPARIAFLLFLFLAGFYALTSAGHLQSMDEYMMYDQTESLVMRQSLAVPQSLLQNNFFGAFDRFGQPRTPFPPGLALAAAPAYALGLAVVSPMRLPLRQTMLILRFAACMTNAFLAAGAVAIFFLLLVRMGFRPRTALLTSLLVAFTTMLWPYSGYFFSEPLATLLLVLTAFVLFGRSTDEPAYPLRVLVLAGLLLAALVWVRFYHIIALAALCPALVAVEKRLRPALVVGAIACASLGLYLAYNHYLFGGFFHFAYPPSVEGGTHPTSFPTPLYVGVGGMLFSPGKSIFIFMPLVLPAIWGVSRIWRRNRGLGIFIATLPLVYLFFFAKYIQWEGGRAPGPRYLLPPAILLCLAVAPLLESASLRQRILVRAAALAGLVVQIVSIATSYLEAEVAQGYYNHLVQYQLSYCQFAEQWRLLWRYATHASQPLHVGWDFYGTKFVDFASIPGLAQQLDAGWDRWFLYLHRNAVPMEFIVVVLILQSVAVLGFGLLLVREYRRTAATVKSRAQS